LSVQSLSAVGAITLTFVDAIDLTLVGAIVMLVCAIGLTGVGAIG
jgi:hypothetical protein